MSSLGGNTQGGNSVDPGVPGAGNVDRWSKYQAISDVDVGGYKIVNADIDLCNDAIENVGLKNCTIIDTLTNSGTIQGGTIDGATITNGTLNGGTLQGTITNSGLIQSGSYAGGTLQGTFTNSGVISGGTVDNATFSNGTINNANATNTTLASGTLNGTTTLAGGHQFSGDMYLKNDMTIENKTQEQYNSNLYLYGGDGDSARKNNILIRAGVDNGGGGPPESYIQYEWYPATGVNRYARTAIYRDGFTGIDRYAIEMDNTGEMISCANTGRVGIKKYNPAAELDVNGSILTNGSITGSGRSPITNGIAMQQGDFTSLASSDFYTNNATIQTGTFAVKIQSPFGLPLQLEGQNGVIDMTGNSSITNVVMGRISPTYGYAQSAQKNLKWLGTGSSQIINGLEFVAPNGTSRCFAFIGQRSGPTPSSMGLASKNDHSSTIVGFAPSAISGIEKWSFTAKHQCQYKGKLGKEHYGMVVSATGDVVGLYDKGNVKFGIDHKDPDYSNAVPVVELCNKRASKSVIGVIKEITDTPETTKGDIVVQWDEDGYEIGDKRIQVNSIGEGLIWVANTNGNLEVGDLLQSSSIPGYAEKQDDDIMRSCTIGKVTMACDFKQAKVPGKKIMTNYKKENLLDTEGRLKWTNSIVKQDKYKMRTLSGGKKACLLSCIYYCG